MGPASPVKWAAAPSPNHRALLPSTPHNNQVTKLNHTPALLIQRQRLDGHSDTCMERPTMSTLRTVGGNLPSQMREDAYPVRGASIVHCQYWPTVCTSCQMDHFSDESPRFDPRAVNGFAVTCMVARSWCIIKLPISTISNIKLEEITSYKV